MKLQDLQHLRDDKRIRFTEEVVNGETLTIVCYMVADPSLWLLPMAKECRGVVFNSAGVCVSRPFHKFFNIGENEDTQVHLLKGKQFEILEKRDGSMLTPVMVGGEIFWKTKKSFYSEVAVEASKNIPANVNLLAEAYINAGMTPIFEYTSPFNKIVINYGESPDFVLLAVRDTATGEYVTHTEMEKFSLGVKVISKFDKSLEQCLSEVPTLTDFEGWCLRDVATGFYCKLKTEWYLFQHRARTELRERDCFDMWLDEKLDDIKSSLSLEGFDLTPIEDIEQRASNLYTHVVAVLDGILEGIEDKTNFKQIAETYKTHELFGLIMSSVRGKEPDIKKLVAQRYREEFSLSCVYNKNF